MTSKSAADYKHVQAVLRQLETGAQSLEQLWETRKLKLDLCLQLRMFEREALEVRTRTCTLDIVHVHVHVYLLYTCTD